MLDLLFKVWFFIAILPFTIFLEGNKMFAKFLKRKDIYAYWDVWHAFLLLLSIILLVLWLKGYSL
ncbi:MAG: hypothetical protein AAB687_00225 [Patescibacteria group bacterium]